MIRFSIALIWLITICRILIFVNFSHSPLPSWFWTWRCFNEWILVSIIGFVIQNCRRHGKHDESWARRALPACRKLQKRSLLSKVLGPKCLSAKMSMVRKILLPKWSCAEKSLWPNVHGYKIHMCWYVNRAKTCTAEMSGWWNVRAKMSLDKMSGAKICRSQTYNPLEHIIMSQSESSCRK